MENQEKEKTSSKKSLRAFVREQQPLITIALSGVSISVAIVAIFLGYRYFTAASDLRYSFSTASSMKNAVVERTFDQNGNLLFYCKLMPTFTNLGTKSGFITKVVAVPLSIATNVSKTEVLRIDSVEIQPGQERQVEVRVLIMFPTGAIPNLNKPMDFLSEIVFDAFDNVGKKIDRRTDGNLYRLKFDFKGTFKFETKQ